MIIWLTAIGAFLRLYRLEASLQFLGDQGRDALILRNMLVNYDLPFIGPVTSVGSFFLGPLYYYLMAPFLWLFKFNPAGPAYATAIIGILTIPALYLVTKKMLSASAAKLAALFYTFGFIPIIETRGAWNPNPMPLAGLGIVFGFYQALKTNQPRWLWLSAFSLGAALQFHYMIVFLAPFLLYQLILIFKKPPLRKHLITWLIILILMMLPLILFELKNNFLNIKGLIVYLTKDEYRHFDFWEKFKNLRGRSEEAIGMILGFGRTTTFIRTWITRGVLLFIGLFLLKKPSSGFKTISLWLLLSIASIAFYYGSIPPYYLAFLFPAVFMLIGEILSRLKGKLLFVSLAFMVVFTAYNLPQTWTDLNSNGNLKSVRTTARFIKDDIDQHGYQNYNLALLDGTRDYPAHSFRYFLEVFGGQPLSQAEYPQTQVLYIISPYLQANVLAEQIWEIESVKPAVLTSAWEFATSENIYKIEKQ